MLYPFIDLHIAKTVNVIKTCNKDSYHTVIITVVIFMNGFHWMYRGKIMNSK